MCGLMTDTSPLHERASRQTTELTELLTRAHDLARQLSAQAASVQTQAQEAAEPARAALARERNGTCVLQSVTRRPPADVTRRRNAGQREESRSVPTSTVEAPTSSETPLSSSVKERRTRISTSGSRPGRNDGVSLLRLPYPGADSGAPLIYDKRPGIASLFSRRAG